MAANTGNENGNGRINYYHTAYGMLVSNAKEAPEGFEKIELNDIKSKVKKKDKIYLNKKYYDSENGKDYPLKVFYPSIDGIIQGVKKESFDKNTFLKLELLDIDDDTSFVSFDFYGKESANLLNRLANVPDREKSLTFIPYMILNTFETEEGEQVTHWLRGVSIKDDGETIKAAFNYENGLPPTERIENAKGDLETSRVKQVNFLWNEVSKIYGSQEAEAPKETKAAAPKAAKTEKPTEIKKTTKLPF